MRHFVVVVSILLAACKTASAPANSEGEVREALARLNALLLKHDPAIVDEFLPEAVFIGSEADEVLVGRDQLAPFFKRVVEGAVTVSWDWKRTDVSVAGNVAWVFAQGEVVIASAGKENRRPYRVTAVLERGGAKWKWRLFHGSEPVQHATVISAPPANP
jgi:ketosteroid isomerase-like protein